MRRSGEYEAGAGGQLRRLMRVRNEGRAAATVSDDRSRPGYGLLRPAHLEGWRRGDLPMERFGRPWRTMR